MTEQAGGKGPPSKLTMSISLITHLLLIIPVVYIIILAFTNFNFFAWHPVCMSLGAGLLLMEGVYSISGEPNLTAKYSRRNRTTIHWILNTLGISLIACGFIIVFINKVNLDKPHFATTHGILGLTTIILVCLVALFGIVANNTQWLYPKVRPVILKVAHAFGGIAITILLLVTLSNGTYRHWWPGSEVGRGLVITAFVLSALLILTKPILGAVSRSRLIFQRPASSTSS